MSILSLFLQIVYKTVPMICSSDLGLISTEGLKEMKRSFGQWASDNIFIKLATKLNAADLYGSVLLLIVIVIV